MKANPALTARLLLLTLLAAVPAVWALEFPSPITGHPAGCHDSTPGIRGRLPGAIHVVPGDMIGRLRSRS
jgi:hypothetical protein